jgi:hypothetical protein
LELKEEAIQLAINDVKSGRYNQSEAAQRRGVSKSTLWGRLNGRTTRHEAHKHEQVLSDAEELEILLWCHQMERRYLPVRLSHVIACAESILNNRRATTDAHLGENWYRRFLERHPNFRLTTSKRIDEKRVMARNPAYIMEFYMLVSFRSDVTSSLTIHGSVIQCPSKIQNFASLYLQYG